MANVTLSKAETEPGMLPRVCCRCGIPADAEKKVKFSWYPQWVLFIALINLLICAIVAMILRKERTVYLPVCEDHNSYWKGPELFSALSILGAICMAIGMAVVSANNPQLKDYVLIVMLVDAVWVIVALIIGAIWQQRYVRTTRITDKEIMLKNVHANFVEALEQDRDRDWEEYEAQRQARRAKRRERERERDDYDDE